MSSSKQLQIIGLGGIFVICLFLTRCGVYSESPLPDPSSQIAVATPTRQLNGPIPSPSAPTKSTIVLSPTSTNLSAQSTDSAIQVTQDTSRTVHPYLLFDNQTVVEYRQEIKEKRNFRQEIYLGLEDYLMKSRGSGESTSLLANAFLSQLVDEPSHLDEARQLLLERVSEECWEVVDSGYCQRDRDAANTLGQVSLAYDWLYPQLSEGEREQVKARIALEVCRYYEAFTYGKNNTWERWNNWWMTDYTQNHFHSVTGGMVLGALAIKDDEPPLCTATDQNGQQSTVTVREILRFGLEKMERNRLVFDRITDGSYPEGDSYVTAYSETYLSSLWATKRLATDVPDLSNEGRLKRFPLFYLYNAAPGQLWKPLTNHGDHYSSSRANYTAPKDLHFVATLYRDKVANWAGKEYYYNRDGGVKLPSNYHFSAGNLVLDFIFLDPALETLSPAEAGLDLSYHATDWEGVFMRSDWSDRSVAAAIKVGPPGGHTAYNIARSNEVGGDGQEPAEFDLVADHMHADANGIYLYANKTFLLPEMMGYAGRKTTLWGPYTSSHNTILVSDDLGQMQGQILGDHHRQFWEIETPETEVGILEHASTQGYDYSLGQATSAYGAELGLKRFHRHVLFVREPGYMLVVDDLDAERPKTYDWMGHSTGMVSREGQWLKVHADNEQRLGVAVVSPVAFEFAAPRDRWQGIELKDVVTFKYVSENRAMYEWNIRQDCQRCRFINILYPTDEARWGQKPVVTGLVDTEQLAAVEVQTAGGKRVDILAVSLTQDQMQTAGPLVFDGRVAAVEKTGSTVRRALLIQGTSLKQGDIDLIRDLPSASFLKALYGTENPISFLEVQYEDNKLILRSSDPTGAILFARGVTAVFLQRVDENNVVVTDALSFTREGDYITLMGLN